ncbi:hypothetical protein RQM65_03760 [Pricia sp. S334]|uniref:Uncharacterized protein n=1 Tax=Pricia mediterranea TaxID=3076079 RepID=A0ABU3L221_9FLAO|nr:hypothetical protein [Pricia sp. S334]MDT7827780.1 hypothetical protein [Pricia sp. S334]
MNDETNHGTTDKPNETVNDKPGKTQDSRLNKNDVFTLITYVIAIGALIAYGYFIHFLTGKAKFDDPEWSRLIYLFSGVEAIVFAAAGFLFGKEVNRKRAENAEKEKNEAKQEKNEIKQEKNEIKEEKKGVEEEKKQVEAEMRQVERQKEEIKEEAFKERQNALILGEMAVLAEQAAAGAPPERSALEGTAARSTPASIARIAAKARKMYPELNE